MNEIERQKYNARKFINGYVMEFAVFDPSLLTVRINCCFLNIYLAYILLALALTNTRLKYCHLMPLYMHVILFVNIARATVPTSDILWIHCEIMLYDDECFVDQTGVCLNNPRPITNASHAVGCVLIHWPIQTEARRSRQSCTQTACIPSTKRHFAIVTTRRIVVRERGERHLRKYFWEGVAPH